MSPTTHTPELTPIPVPLSAHEGTEVIVPPLSRPTRGPTCKIGDHRLLHLIFWGLYPGMPGQGWRMPNDAHGPPDIHETNVSSAVAPWAAAGSLERVFMARVGQLSAETKLAGRVRHGDGTQTVAKHGERASGLLAIHLRRGRSVSP
jgi:hypothetical protein